MATTKRLGIERNGFAIKAFAAERESDCEAAHAVSELCSLMEKGKRAYADRKNEPLHLGARNPDGANHSQGPSPRRFRSDARHVAGRGRLPPHPGSDRQTGLYLGEAGFADFRRDMDPPLGPAPEAGWALVSSRHGRGLATEVVLAAHVWMDAHNPHDHTLCILDAQHQASRRIAEKCGYRHAYETAFAGGPTSVMKRLSSVAA